MNLALRDIRHNLGRFLLTALGLALLFGVAEAMLGIYGGLVEEAVSLARSTRADLWIVEGGSRGPFAEASRIPGDVREAAARLAGVRDAGSLTMQTVEARRAGGPGGAEVDDEQVRERGGEAGRPRVGTVLRLQVVGYEPGRPGGPPGIAEGRGITRGRLEMVVDRSAALLLAVKDSFPRRVILGVEEIAAFGVLVCLLCLVGSLLGVRLALRVEPAQALGG